MLFLWLVAGLIVGAGIDLMAFRLPRREPLLSMPTRCGNCGAALGSLELVPLLGYLITRGKCRVCGAQPILKSVLIELVTMAVFGALFLRFGLSWVLVIYSLYAAILVLVFVIDLEHRLILNVVTYPSIIVALALSFVTPGLNGFSGLLGGLFYGGLFLALYVASVLIYKRDDALGQGDVKLALFIGLITGMPGALTAALLGTALGALAGIWALMVKRVSSKSAIPYGTALCAGALVVLIWTR
ncbi:MAG: prepilin peptidase [Chloroflexi bacterium]|nr:prepilin peptidase [Chloroflexota bacterium]